MVKKSRSLRRVKSGQVARGDAAARTTGPDPKRSISRCKNSESKPKASDSLPEAVDRWTTCPTCGEKVKERNFEKHRKRAHKKVLTKAEKLAEQRKKPPKARDYERSTDLLDQPYVVSGGGFGVGKGKKR